MLICCLRFFNKFPLLILCCAAFNPLQGISEAKGLPLYYWQEEPFVNFGDYLSLKIVERILGIPISIEQKPRSSKQKKLLALGSLLYFAKDNDVLWGTGCNYKFTKRKDYNFSRLDVRAVRGPLTRDLLMKTFEIDCPEIYGDPGLLVPYLFPEFKKKQNPSLEYIVIPHYSEIKFFEQMGFKNVVKPTDPWNEVIEKILDSRFVISSALHGIIIAEAFDVPVRMLRVTENEPFFKYQDYYFGTNRPHFRFATSIQEALALGGETPYECDLEKLYNAFPFDFWPHIECKKFNFPK